MSTAPLPIAILTEDGDLRSQLAAATIGLEVIHQSWNGNGVDSAADQLAEHLAEHLASRQFHAVCIGPDVPESLALDLSRTLDRSHPEVGVVLMRTPTADLWREAARAGVRDIIAPEDLTALTSALEETAERGAQLRAAQRATTEGPRSRVIVVLSPKGGSGKTMLTTNLGVALAFGQRGQTVAIDLDCVFGDVASVLGLVPEHTIGQLATMPSFDSTALKVFLARHERSGLYVLPGSGRPEEGEAITDEVATRILQIAAREFPFVVVDTAAGLDERALAAIDQATDIVLLASMDVASVRNLGKEIDALDRLGVVTPKRHFILNRADTHVGLEVADVESALGLTVDAALPSSRLVPLSMNQGRTLVLDEPDSPVARALLGFAARFLDIDAPAAGPSKTSVFSRWRR